jgi:outer membrane lipoprotein SlyB
MKNIYNSFLFFVCVLALGACSSTRTYVSDYEPRNPIANVYERFEGRILDVRTLYIAENRLSKEDASALGFLWGGLVGLMIGDGSGQVAATLGGAVLGAVVGYHSGDNRQNARRIGQEITVDTWGGRRYKLIMLNDHEYTPGDYVTIEGNGETVRLLAITHYHR